MGKAVVAKFNASQLITWGTQVSGLIRKQLTDRAHDFGIILDDVSITELSFGKEYAAAVEAKQIAQQEAQRASYMVEKAVQEKQQKIVQAEGETAAAKMLGEAISQNAGGGPKDLWHCSSFTEQSLPKCWLPSSQLQ